MYLKKFVIGICILFFIGIYSYGEEDHKILQLKIGNPKFKDKTITIKPGQIFSPQNEKVISFSQMISELKEAKIVYVGETHNSLPIHKIQCEIATALYLTDKNLVMGLEMYNINNQEPLTKWSHGILTEEEFIDQAKWYVNWNFNFNYYKCLFDLAKNYKIPFYALNAPRKIIRKIRIMGWKSLNEEEKEIVPEPDLTNADHRTLMKTIFGDQEMPKAMKGHGGTDMMFNALYRSQCSWDEVMAKNTLRAVNVEDKRMIVFVGSGHLLYNTGINMRAYSKQPLPNKTIICVPVPKGEQGIEVSQGLADYIWGIEEETRPVYPSVGLSLKKFDGLYNPVIERDPISGVTKGRNFKKGDVILLVDGKRYFDINNLRKYLSTFTWGDKVKFKLLRNAKQIEVELLFELIEEKDEKSDIKKSE